MTILNMIQNADLLLAGQNIPEPAMPFKKMPFIEVSNKNHGFCTLSKKITQEQSFIELLVFS